MASQGFSANPKRSAKARRDKKIKEEKNLLNKLNKINKKIKGGTLSGRNLLSQQKVKERLEREIQDIDKKSAGMLAATSSSPVVKAVNEVERIATSNTGTRKAQPRSKPNPVSGLLGVQRALKNTPRGSDAPSRRPTVGGDMMGTTPPGGGTLSKKDVDEYAEAFASPDADKMYNLSEKNRRKDMNMLERGFDSIKVAGERASADRKKRGLSDYDMNEDVFGSRSGGGIKKTMKKKKSSVRKRAAKRGFGVETRGN